MVKNKLLIILLIICISNIVEGVISFNSLQSPEGGARALIFESGFVGLADDNSAIFYNSAGLGEMEDFVISVTHEENIQSMRYSSINLIYPYLPIGKFGIACSLFYIVGLEKTDSVGNNIGEYNCYNFNCKVSYGLKLADSVLVGGGLKYFYSKILDFSSSLVLLGDAGVVYILDFFEKQPIRIGLSINNLGNTFKFADEEYRLPINIRAGLSTKFSFDPFYVILSPGINYILNEKRITFDVGLESLVFNYFILRLGYHIEKDVPLDIRSLKIGAGMESLGYIVDYTFSPGGDMGVGGHRLSFSYTF